MTQIKDMIRFGFVAASSLALVTFSASSAMAIGKILQPVGATASSSIFPASNIINQSGLSTSYISGVTDFNTYTTTATHTSAPGIDWIGSGSTALLTFDLGSSEAIDSFALWNFSASPNSLGVNEFQLFADNDNNFVNGTTSQLGNNLFAALSTSNPASAQVFNLTATDTQYVHMNILSNHGAADVALGEVAFQSAAASVPFEFSPSLGLLAVGGIWGASRLRKNLATRKEASKFTV